MPLQPPPRDADGNIIPHDHDGILPTDTLIRRISEFYVVGEEGNRKISSMAFQESSDGTGMSVDIEKLIVEDGKDPREFVTSEEFFCSVAFNAKAARDAGIRVGYYPLTDNPHHGALWGITSRGKKNTLRRESTWFVQGEGIALNDGQ